MTTVHRHVSRSEELLKFAGDAIAASEYRRRKNRLDMARKIKKFLSVPKFTTRARGPARFDYRPERPIYPSYPPLYTTQVNNLRSWVLARGVDWRSVTQNNINRWVL